MSDQERWTIGRLLHWTTDYLKQHGSGSPRLDAEILLSEARECPRIALYTAFEEEPAEPVRSKFRDFVKRRAAGEPVAYLVGRREFYSLPFVVNASVLIPRPETELVVVAVLDAIKQHGGANGPIRIVDMGTGSGAIAVSVAKHAPHAQILAVDISAAALEVARENAARHEVADRIAFLECDLFAAVPGDQQFDIIASNPPYVADREIELLAKETRDFEPRGALFAGPTGLEVIRRLIDQAAARLFPGGWLIFEISPMIEVAAKQALEQPGTYSGIRTIKDLAGLPRVLVGRLDFTLPPGPPGGSTSGSPR